jgi:hypothetical protein
VEAWVYQHRWYDYGQDWYVELLAWMETNGVSPDVVPSESTLVVAEGYLRTEVYELSNGQPYLDADGAVVRGERTFRLVSAPPRLPTDVLARAW